MEYPPHAAGYHRQPTRRPGPPGSVLDKDGKPFRLVDSLVRPRPRVGRRVNFVAKGADVVSLLEERRAREDAERRYAGFIQRGSH